MAESKKFWKPGGAKPPKVGKTGGKEGRDKGGDKDKKSLKMPGVTGGAVTLTRAADPAAANPILSKSVMSMKFMKRKADDSEELAAEASKRSRLLDGSVRWERDASLSAGAGAGAGADPSASLSDSAEDTLYQMQKLNASQNANTDRAITQLSSGAGAPASRGPELQCTFEKTSLWTALPGRRSFGGFNKVIEKWHSSVMDTRRQEARYEDKDKGGGGSASGSAMLEDEDMLKKYENLVSLPRGPSMGGRPVKSESGSGKHKKHGGVAGAGAGGQKAKKG